MSRNELYQLVEHYAITIGFGEVWDETLADFFFRKEEEFKNVYETSTGASLYDLVIEESAKCIS